MLVVSKQIREVWVLSHILDQDDKHVMDGLPSAARAENRSAGEVASSADVCI
jgi:hypothetical protein